MLIFKIWVILPDANIMLISASKALKILNSRQNMTSRAFGFCDILSFRKEEKP